MLIRPLFDKYQKYLLAFANTSYGRGFLELDKWAKIKNNYKIIKVAPDGIHWFTGEYTKRGEAICQAVFFSKSQYLKKFDLALTGLDICSKTINKIVNPELVIPHYAGLTTVNWLPLCMFTSKEFNPDAHVESTTVDGLTGRIEPVNESFEDIVSNTGNYVSDSDVTDGGLYLMCSATTNQFGRLWRDIALYDTSTIPAGATITSAVLSLYFDNSGTFTTLGTPDLHCCSSSPASNISLVNADYSQLGSTSFGSIANASVAIGYNDITVNASGLANVTKAGISKFGWRISWDILNSFGGSWGDNRSGGWRYFYMADNGSNKPKLVVTYIPDTSPFPTFHKS
jgi:hypothetical protein